MILSLFFQFFKKPFGILLLSLMAFSCQSKHSKTKLYYPDATWEKVKEDSPTWDAQKLDAARAYSSNLNEASVLILYKGKILRAWGDIDRKIPLHSVRKSFMSAMYGPLVKEGIIDTTATIEELGIDDIDSLSTTEKKATVRMLLQARSGIYHPAAFETKGMAASRPKRHSHAPGTYWYYNNWDFNVIGEIFKEKTGEDIFEGFKRIIGDPIGMEDFNPETDGRYAYDLDKSKYPGYPFKMSAKNAARFGLLMLRNGQWKDQQIIPESWVKESTKIHSKGNSGGGYGLMWRVAVGPVSPLGGNKVHHPQDTYTARGYKGHVITIIPSQDLVFVYNNNDANGGTTSYLDIGKLLEMILDAKQN